MPVMAGADRRKTGPGTDISTSTKAGAGRRKAWGLAACPRARLGLTAHPPECCHWLARTVPSAATMPALRQPVNKILAAKNRKDPPVRHQEDRPMRGKDKVRALWSFSPGCLLFYFF